MLEAITDETGKCMARATCDDCDRTWLMPAKHADSARMRMGKNGQTRHLASPGKVTTRLQSQGWQVIGKKLRCQKCVEERRAQAAPSTPEASPQKEITPMTVTKLPTKGPDQPRQPTREQKREIMGILEVSYDTKAGRYKGRDTDKTVAEVIGGGVLSGWVAEIREEFFGPEGGNSEMADIEAAITALVQQIEKHEQAALAAADQARKHSKAAADLGDEARNLKCRIEAVKQAVGPRAARA